MEAADKGAMPMSSQKKARLISILLLLFMSAPAIVYASPTNEASVVITHEQIDLVDSGIDQRSWYGTSMAFSRTAYTSEYSFDGTNVGIEMTCTSSKSGSFTVYLWRKTIGGSERVGSASFNRNGFTKATWTNVGSGTYFFILSKANDGTVVTCSDIAMYSW